MATDMEWAYLAGLIDGEGSILINERNSDRNNWGSYLRLVITNTDPRMIVWLRERFGGTVVTWKRDLTGKNHRHQMKWHVACRKAYELLHECYPYLITKKDQADIAFAYEKTIRGPGGRKKTPVAVVEYRKQLREQLHTLKLKGYSAEELERIKNDLVPPETAAVPKLKTELPLFDEKPDLVN